MNKCKFTSEKGASSVLVILLMVILLSLGVAILTSSISNERLALKKKDWLNDYYSLEAQSETIISEIDSILIDAQNSTNFENSDNLDTNEYMTNVLRSLDDYSQLYGSNVTNFDPMEDMTYHRIVSDNSLIIEFDTKIDGEYPKHLKMELRVNNPYVDLSYDENDIFNRYDIVSSIEWQSTFEYNTSTKFQNPF